MKCNKCPVPATHFVSKYSNEYYCGLHSLELLVEGGKRLKVIPYDKEPVAKQTGPGLFG